MLQANVIFYNDTPDLLKRCLTSLKGKVDRILAVDGKWRNFEGSTNSDDGCYECAQQLADEVIRPTEPWFNQIAKRNACLTLDSTNDFYLHVDADEYVEGFIDQTLLDKDFYYIKLFTEGDNGTDYCRLFRNLEGLKYKKKHSWLWVGDKIVNHEPNAANIFQLDTLKIFHTPNARPQERQQKDAEYIAKRNEPKEIPHEQYLDRLKVKSKWIKDTTIKCMHGTYNGFDRDGVWFKLDANQQITITKEKAEELVNEKDYNEQFKIVE